MEEKQLVALRKLNLTEEEIADVLKSDKEIDKGAKLFNLTPEQEKASKKARSTGTKQPTAYKFTKRERKENTTKAAIIAEIAHFLTENAEIGCKMVEITNKERQIAFKVGENAYELTLVQKRKAK